MAAIDLVGVQQDAEVHTSTYYGYDDWDYDHFYNDNFDRGYDTWNEIRDALPYEMMGVHDWTEYTIEGTNTTTQVMDFFQMIAGHDSHFVFTQATDNNSNNETWQMTMTSESGENIGTAVFVITAAGADIWGYDGNGNMTSHQTLPNYDPQRIQDPQRLA